MNMCEAAVFTTLTLPRVTRTPAACICVPVYLCTRDEFYGLSGYKPQVSDERHDNTWFEIGELMRLLMKSNPTVLETLFIP